MVASRSATDVHDRVWRHLLSELDLKVLLILADELHAQRPFFTSSRVRPPSFLTDKTNHKTLYRQMFTEFQVKSTIPFIATD